MQDVVSPRKPHDPPWRSRTAHRSLDPDVAAILARARAERGWSLSASGRRTGISRRMLGMLEHGQRVPSVGLAEALIEGYRLGLADTAMLRAVALPNVGRDSPLRERSPSARASRSKRTDDRPAGSTPLAGGASSSRPATAACDPASPPPVTPAERFVRPAGDGPRGGTTQLSPFR
jgi:transcriptional regulator with XRE-family HTH domain